MTPFQVFPPLGPWHAGEAPEVVAEFAHGIRRPSVLAIVGRVDLWAQALEATP